jgi:phosphatidate cytidylyltransferase
VAGMEQLANPLADPEFRTFMVRTAAILLAGLVVMTLTQIAHLGRMVRSLAFKKFLTWIVILPGLLVVIHSGRLPFLLLVGIMIWRSSAEMLHLLRIAPFFRGVFALNMVVTFAVMALSIDHVHFLPAFYLLSTFIAAGVRGQMYHVVMQAAVTIIGSVWIGYFLALFMMLYDQPDGRAVATLVFGMVIVADVFAYLLGGIARKTGLGREALASNISPNKTRAGLYGSVIGTAISYFTFGTGLGHEWWAVPFVVIPCGVGAAYGDLAESIVKRSAGVKDSGDLIPYHGGMLDRIDSLLFVVPLYSIVTTITGHVQGWLQTL